MHNTWQDSKTRGFKKKLFKHFWRKLLLFYFILLLILFFNSSYLLINISRSLLWWRKGRGGPPPTYLTSFSSPAYSQFVKNTNKCIYSGVRHEYLNNHLVFPSPPILAPLLPSVKTQKSRFKLIKNALKKPTVCLLKQENGKTTKVFLDLWLLMTRFILITVPW